MKPKLTPLKIAPAAITYINGKPTVQLTIANTQLTDWITRKTLQSMLDIKSRTLQTLRSTNKIPLTQSNINDCKINHLHYWYIVAINLIVKIISTN